MRCPVDGAELTMAERQGVEIDYCPKCRGVWLDRGELDKIIDRSTPSLALPEPGRGLLAGALPDLDRREVRREASAQGPGEPVHQPLGGEGAGAGQ